MKRTMLRGLVGFSFMWVPAVYSMDIPQEVQLENLIEQQKEDKVLPIVLVHGLKQQGKDIQSTTDLIKKLAPGTEVYTPSLGCWGFAPEEAQAQELTNYINSIDELKNGFNLAGYSNGGIVARAVAQEGKVPRIYSLVTIASPHRGVCGFPYEWDENIDKTAKKYFGIEPLNQAEKLTYKVMYPAGDLPFSISSIVDLWHEPTQKKTYLSQNKFLPIYNNEKKHPNFDDFRHNLTVVGTFLCLAGDEDKTVEPWQSTRWDYFDAKRKKIVSIQHSPIFKNLGLQELGSRFQCVTVKGEGHGSIRDDKATFIKYLIPALARQSALEHDAGKDVYEDTQLSWWRHFVCCK